MTTLARALAVALILALALPAWAVAGGKRGSSGGPVHVDGYFRKDGTYVAPHARSAPNSSPYDNYGMPGNYNPNRGTVTPGDQNRYLERYQERQLDMPRWPR